MRLIPYIPILLLVCCQSARQIHWPKRSSSVTGSEFYGRANKMKWKERDSLAVKEILGGSVPAFMKKFVRVKVVVKDPEKGTRMEASFYVSPDYLSIGTSKDWARIPLTPMAAQKIADQMDCFLPTRKMVNDIYDAARIKPEPMPMYSFRDSTPVMWRHHLIIEGQRQGRKGLIAGIKKDVVISGLLSREIKPDRVAIFGWHTVYQKPVQPLYAGHINTYVDYSHGIRLASRKIRVKGPGRHARRKWMDYIDVLKDPVLQKLICDEPFCDFYKYTY